MTTNQALQGNQITNEDKPKPLDIFRGQLEGNKGEFLKVLPSHISFEKFQRTVMTAIVTSPDLLTADRQSLLVSCIKAATDGLMPDSRDAALVVFKAKQGDKWIQKVQYMPMYAGILKKVRNSGELSSVVTHVVYAKDKFEYVLGDDEKIIHAPYMGSEDRGEIIAAYCIAKLKDGSIIREVMSRHDIEKIRRASKAGAMSENDVKYSKDKNAKIGDPKGIWAAWYEEMARKTVFRRTAKWLPQNIEIYERAFENDDTMKGFDIIAADDAIAIEDQSGEVSEGEDGEERAESQPDLKESVKEKKAKEKGEKKPADAPKEEKAAEEQPEAQKPHCENCGGKGSAEWVDPDTGETGIGPCRVCATPKAEQGKLV